MRPNERLLRRGIPKTEIKKSLEAWADSLSAWEHAATVTVAIGLIMELTSSLARFLPTSAYLGLLPHLHRTSDFGEALVTIGVVAEVVIGSMSGRVETSLREENNRLVQEASERVLQAEKKLRRRTESRFLPEDEKVKLVELLRPFAGQEFIATTSQSPLEGIVPPNKALERALFAGQLQAICSEAGWIPKRGSIKGLNVGPGGVVVFIPPTPESKPKVPPASAHALVDALIHLDIPCQYGTLNENNAPLVIAIGLIS